MTNIYKCLTLVKKICVDNVIDSILKATDNVARYGTIGKLIALLVSVAAIYFMFKSVSIINVIVILVLHICSEYTR